MADFKPGAVVNYGATGRAEAIIDHVDDANASLVLLAWRGSSSGLWMVGRGRLIASGTTLHPDPDAVWADFVKWQLTK